MAGTAQSYCLRIVMKERGSGLAGRSGPNSVHAQPADDGRRKVVWRAGSSSSMKRAKATSSAGGTKKPKADPAADVKLIDDKTSFVLKIERCNS